MLTVVCSDSRMLQAGDEKAEWIQLPLVVFAVLGSGSRAMQSPELEVLTTLRCESQERQPPEAAEDVEFALEGMVVFGLVSGELCAAEDLQGNCDDCVRRFHSGVACGSKGFRCVGFGFSAAFLMCLAHSQGGQAVSRRRKKRRRHMHRCSCRPPRGRHC